MREVDECNGDLNISVSGITLAIRLKAIGFHDFTVSSSQASVIDNKRVFLKS